MRLAIVGAGGMGSFHARSLAALPGVEIVAIADVRLAAAESLERDRRWHSRPPTGSQSPSRSDLDGVVIASPEDSHEELVHAALGQGTRILCEKPLAVGAAVVSSESSMPRSRSVGGLLQLGLMRVFDPAHVQLAAEVAELGELNHVRCVHRNVHEVRRTAQLILNQSLVHDIHSLRWLVGRDITRVMTLGHAQRRSRRASAC